MPSRRARCLVRRAVLAAGGEPHLYVLLLLRGRRRAATPEKPPQPNHARSRRRFCLCRRRRHQGRQLRLRLGAAGADVILRPEEEDVGGEVGGVRVGLGRVHGRRRERRGVDGGAAAERAGGVGLEPHVDAVDVEAMAAAGQHAGRVPGCQLGDAHGAVRGGVPLGDLLLGQGRHGGVVQASVVEPESGAGGGGRGVRGGGGGGAAEQVPQVREDAAAGGRRRGACSGGGALGAEADVEAEHEGEEDGRHRRQHRRRRRHRRSRHRHRKEFLFAFNRRPSLRFSPDANLVESRRAAVVLGRKACLQACFVVSNIF